MLCLARSDSNDDEYDAKLFALAKSSGSTLTASVDWRPSSTKKMTSTSTTGPITDLWAAIISEIMKVEREREREGVVEGCEL